MSEDFNYSTEIYNHCEDPDVFHEWGNKIAVIEFDVNIQPEEGKTIGKVLLKGIVPKLELGQYVKFNNDRRQFQTARDYNEKKLAVVNAYWCKKYIPEAKLMVPVKCWLPKKKQFEVEFQLMTKNQFIGRRTRELQANWPYKYALGVANCNKLFSKGRYYAINSTVRHYAVDQKELESYWGKYNKFLAILNREWEKLFKQTYEQDLAFRQLDGMHNKIRSENIDKKLNGNVIQLKKQFKTVVV